MITAQERAELMQRINARELDKGLSARLGGSQDVLIKISVLRKLLESAAPSPSLGELALHRKLEIAIRWKLIEWLAEGNDPIPHDEAAKEITDIIHKYFPAEDAHLRDLTASPTAAQPTEKSKLPGSFDAMDWVREWLATIKKNPTIPTDEGTMLAWFANAIMAGWDEHARRYPAAAQGQKAVAWFYVERAITWLWRGLQSEALVPNYRQYMVDAHVDLLEAEALLKAPIAAKGQEVAEMEARKDAAYLERNQVVAALAKCFPSGVARTAIEGWSEDWHGCVYIDLPTGQASWHFHDSQAYLFSGLPPYRKPWDGHSTEEKYKRLAALASPAPVPEGWVMVPKDKYEKMRAALLEAGADVIHSDECPHIEAGPYVDVIWSSEPCNCGACALITDLYAESAAPVVPKGETE